MSKSDEPKADSGTGNRQEETQPEVMPELEAKLESLPPELSETVRAIVTQAFYSGPLPHPVHLGKYEAILPGSANRIISLAEKEAAHRQALEKKLVEAEIKDRQAERSERRIGQILGFGIGTITIVSGAVLAAMGQPWAGGFIGTAGVVGLVSVFVYGRRAAANQSGDDAER